MTAIDLLGPEALADPYRPLARLRETAPVSFDERTGAWLVTRHADVLAAFGDPRLSADRISGFLSTRPHLDATYQVLRRWMVFNDPPEHTRLRRLVHRSFTPRVIQQLEARVAAVVDELLDALAGHDEADLVPALAYPLPAIVIAELLGVPPEDRDRFKVWSDELATLVLGSLDEPDRHQRTQVALGELTAYLGALVQQRAAEPRDDLLSRLAADPEVDRDEAAAICALLLFAGHETTTNLVANGVLALTRHPVQAAAVAGDPALLPALTEEVLRYDGPVKALLRQASEDLDLHGRAVRAGDRVLLVLTAANRDPRAFSEPDHFDVRRDAGRHLGFGYGIHFCIGAPLARLEARLAFGALLRRFPRLSVADEELTWQPSLMNRALQRLPVRLA